MHTYDPRKGPDIYGLEKSVKGLKLDVQVIQVKVY